ncbi:MAG: hypothetical protein QXZ17_13125 [Nitrososphaerota archaeon]
MPDDIKKIMYWEALRSLLKDLFSSDAWLGRVPNYGRVLIVKILFLQGI